MSVNFAGARTLDDRRRRRLATDDSEAASASVAPSPRSSAVQRGSDELEFAELSPLDALIPRNRFWPASLILCLAGLIGGALYFGTLNHLGMETGLELIEPLYQLETGITNQLIPGLLFIFSAQLCGVIYWHRQQNSRDFNGYYRTWLWASTVWFIYGLAVLSHGHEVFGMVVARGLCLPLKGTESYLWLAPAVAIVVEIVRGLDRELGSNRWAWWLYACCLSSGIVTVAAISGWSPFPTELGNMLLLKISAACTPLLLFAVCLLHAHHVMYVSAAPAPVRHSPILRFIFAIPRMILTTLALVFRVVFGRKLTEEEKAARIEKRRAREAQRQAAIEAKEAERQLQIEERKAAKLAAEQEKQDRIEQARLAKEEKLAAEKARKEALAQEKVAAAEAKAEAKRAAAEAKLEAKAEAKRQQQLAAEQKRQLAEEKAEAAKAEREAAQQAEEEARRATPRRQADVDFETPAEMEEEMQAEPPAQKKPRIRVKSGGKNAQSQHQHDEDQWTDGGDNQSRSNKQSRRVDSGDKLDPNMLKGLSKRERRKLRKEFREQQRLREQGE